MTIDQAFNVALHLHQSGRMAEAEKIYRQILALHPTHADALHYLGVIASQMGRHEAAIQLISRAIAIRPDYPEAYGNLGNALQAAGKLDEAIGAYRNVIALQPNSCDAYGNLGNALKAREQFDEAVAAYQHAIALNPAYSEAHCNLGVTLNEKGQWDDAMAACRRAVQLRANYPEAHCNLGIAFFEKGQLDLAITAYRQAIAQRPGYAEAHCNLGSALKVIGQSDQAIAAFRQALAIRPDYSQAQYNLGNALRDIGDLDAAIAAYRLAIAQAGNLPQASNNLGNVLKDLGQLEQAKAAYRDALDKRNDYVSAYSNLLFTLHYDLSESADMIFREHCRWNELHAEPLAKLIAPHGNARDPYRRLRIGYVSPDFRRHAVSCHVLPLLASHDHARFEIFCYAEVASPDEMTRQFRAHADQWRSTVDLTDEQVAQQVREDAIDILVDLAGHTADNRLLVFARKPAPVQVTRQGYPDTTGMTAIDYRMTDALADPVGLTDPYTTEQLIRLPHTNWIYQPPDGVHGLPTGSVDFDGPVVFGGFNNFAKVNEWSLRLWARILQAVPGSRLLLKDRNLRCNSLRQRVLRILSDAGVTPDRVELCDRLFPVTDYFRLFHRTAVALDPFPYHGTATTCDALWMGVPVITLAGHTHVSRVGVSLLTNVGLPDLIATDPDDYVRIATELANDRSRRKEMRTAIRPRMLASPIMDAPQFARDIEAAYRQMWRGFAENR